MKRLLNALIRRGYNASYVMGEEYDYIKIDDIIDDDYIEISSLPENDEIMLVTENSFVSVNSFKISDIEEAIKILK